MSRENSVVTYNFNKLGDIPPEKLTKEMCRDAMKVSNSIRILQFIPYPDVCLEGFNYFKDTMPLERFVYIQDKAMSKELAEAAVIEDSMCFAVLRNDLITEELAIKAIQTNGILAFDDIPDKCVTPKVYMLLHKLMADDFTSDPVRIPGWLANTENIFSFNLQVEAEFGPTITFEQVVSLYEGKEIKVSRLQRPDKVLRNKTLSFDKETKKIKCVPTLSKQNHTNKISQRKRHLS